MHTAGLNRSHCLYSRIRGDLNPQADHGSLIPHPIMLQNATQCTAFSRTTGPCWELS